MTVEDKTPRFYRVVRTYWIYILASRSRVLYTGVTNDLGRRVCKHKQGIIPGFTQKYRVTRLVYFEQFGDIREAIAREKQIKGWVRARKVKLIEGSNAAWADLAQNWFSSSYRESGRLSS